jgi:hypothetical protein
MSSSLLRIRIVQLHGERHHARSHHNDQKQKPHHEIMHCSLPNFHEFNSAEGKWLGFSSAELTLSFTA